MASQHVYTEKVVGVTFEGRQAVVAFLVTGEQLRLIRELYSVHDANAIRVESLDGREVGYLDRGVAKQIVNAVDAAGGTIPATVIRVTGGGPGKSYGLVITFQVPQDRPLRARSAAPEPSVVPDPKVATPGRRKRWRLPVSGLTIILLLCCLARNLARISDYYPAIDTEATPAANMGAGGAAKATPTRQPRPTTRATARPTAVGSAATTGNQQLSTSSSCIRWQHAERYIGTSKCICGDVSHTKSNKDGVFFIHYDEGPTSFYGVSWEYFWEQGVLEGTCIQLCGEVESNYERPRIVITEPEKQVFLCP